MLTSKDFEFVEELIVLWDVIKPNELHATVRNVQNPANCRKGYQALSDRIVEDSGLSSNLLREVLREGKSEAK